MAATEMLGTLTWCGHRDVMCASERVFQVWQQSCSFEQSFEQSCSAQVDVDTQAARRSLGTGRNTKSEEQTTRSCEPIEHTQRARTWRCLGEAFPPHVELIEINLARICNKTVATQLAVDI